MLTAMAIQPDGRIVLAGKCTDGPLTQFAIMRLTSDGNTDTSFGTAGKVLLSFGSSTSRYDEAHAVKLLPGGKIAIAGAEDSGGIAIAVLNHDGTTDSAFGTDGKVITDISDDAYAYAKDLAIQPDGRLAVIAASAAASNYTESLLVLRYNQDGTLDSTFGTTGIYKPCFAQCPQNSNHFPYGIGIQTDGRIVIGGNFNGSDGTPRAGLMRLIP